MRGVGSVRPWACEVQEQSGSNRGRGGRRCMHRTASVTGQILMETGADELMARMVGAQDADGGKAGG